MTELILTNVHGKIVRGQSFSSVAGNGISITDCSAIVIQDCTFIGCWLNGVSINNSVNIHIIRCYFEDTGGAIYALNSAGIVVTDNKSKNTKKRVGSARGQSIIQMNNCYGAGSCITNNYSFDDVLVATREDAVNVHSSYFSTSSPLIIENNIISGSGPSTSGSGIVVGDGGGSDVIVRNNKLYNPGSGGVCAAGGQRIRFEGNTIYGANRPNSQIGMFVAKMPATHPAPCADVTVINNTIDYTKFTGAKNNIWLDGTTCTNIVSSGTVTNIDLSTMILPVF